MKISGLALAISCLSLFSAHAMAQESERLNSVKTFADTVFDKAGDNYGHNVPLLANGVDPRTGKQMEWIFPDGKKSRAVELLCPAEPDARAGRPEQSHRRRKI